MIVTFTNPTSSPVYVSMLNQTIDPGHSVSAERTQDELDREQQLKDLVTAGQITISYTPEAQDAAIGSLSSDIANYDVIIYGDPVLGLDSNNGTLAAPMKTFDAMMNRKPAVYHKSMRFYLNTAPTTSAQNTTTKTYTLSAQTRRFLFPLAEGKDAESVLIDGGFTNELGDMPCLAGSTSILLNTSTVATPTLDQYKGALLTIVSGTGAGQKRVIRGNSAGANFTIVPEGLFSVVPDATSTFRIGYPNVLIEWSALTLFEEPPQNLFMRGIKFVYKGAGGDDFQIGNRLGNGGGGASLFTGCEWNLNNAGSKGNIRVRGLSPAHFAGDYSYWVGPNNPFVSDDAATGVYIHDGAGFTTNVGGRCLVTGALILNTPIQARSWSSMIIANSTLENSKVTASGDGFFDLNSTDPTQRARMRLVPSGTAVSLTALGKNVAGDGGSPGFNNVEFSDITGDLITMTNGGKAYLGDISVAGTNTGVGLKVQTGSEVQVSSTTLLSGSGGAFKVDSGPVLTLAQVLAAPFGGTLRSNADMKYPIADPGTGVAIPVTVSGNVALVIGAGAETNTLPIPTFVGQTMTFSVASTGGGTRTITSASSINKAGNTNMPLTAAGDTITICAAKVGAALAWRVVSNDGLTLS